MNAQQKKTSGCASNLLAHEDLGHLRKHIVGIYKPSSIMKIPTSIWKWQYRRLSIWRTWCYSKAHVWKKDSNIAPFLFSFFSLFLSVGFFGALFLFRLLWPFLFFFFFHFFNGAMLYNDDQLLFTYNSILQLNTGTKVWLYMNTSGGVPGCAMNQKWHVWKNYERWLCHKYNVNYMIMQSNTTINAQVMYMMMMEVAWQYISEWLWKCHDR